MPLPRLPPTSMTNDAPCCASAGTARMNAGPSRSNSDVIGNFRQLFAPYSRSTQPFRNLFPSRPKQKGCKLKGMYRTREPWIHDFMCPGKREQLEVPSQREKILLIDAGLSGGKISFEHNGNAEHVKEILEIYFPKLKSCGGFEIFRFRRNKVPLKVIIHSCTGYSFIVMFL